MYCPQCATDNLDSSSFCRGCGANISMVSQALSGQLPVHDAEESGSRDSRRRRRSRDRSEEPNLEKGVKNIFMGLAFVFVALAARRYMPGAFTWWFWLFIPAFAMLGGGVAELLKVKMGKDARLSAAPTADSVQSALPVEPQRQAALPQRNTSELIQPPPSVTEGTTRHLETPIKNKRKRV